MSEKMETYYDAEGRFQPIDDQPSAVTARGKRPYSEEELALLQGTSAFWCGDAATAEAKATTVFAAAERVILPDPFWRSLKATAAKILAAVAVIRGDPAAALKMIDITLANGACDNLPAALEDKANTLLALGRWREGWPLMARNAQWAVPQPGVNLIMWDGHPPPSIIFVYQVPNCCGFGDILAYLRFLPLLRERGYGVVFHCMQQIAGLAARSLRGSGVKVAAVETTASANFALPLFGLAAAFAIEPHTIPPPLRLKPDPVLVAKYRSKLPSDVIGLCWASGPGQHPSNNRSIPLAALEPIWSRFPCVSLQVGPARSQIAGTRVKDVLPANPLTWEATAALAACCSRIVSVDTSIVHLAGGLGIPTHVPLHRAANPFFLADIEGAAWQHACPWYTGMRVYRRPADGDCRDVIARIAEALAAS
jgi:hypothetical protein